MEIIFSICSKYKGIKLEINHRGEKNTQKRRRLSNMLLNGYQRKQIMKLKKYLETNENRNMIHQNLQDAAKFVLRGKLIAIQGYLKKREKSQII